jgi:hypothetical protein
MCGSPTTRHCPKCQAIAAKEWLADRQAELLPVPYFHVVFSLPAPIAAIAWQNKAVVYDLLFRAAAEALITIAADPKHLGARIGLTAVLHTWGSALTHHPHVHIIVPGGGISPDGERWIACRPGFFLPVRVLSRLFRRLFLEQLTAAYRGAPAVLRSPGCPGGPRGVQGPPRPITQNRVGGLREAAIRRPGGGAGLPIALYPPRRHRQQSPHRVQ